MIGLLCVQADMLQCAKCVPTYGSVVQAVQAHQAIDGAADDVRDVLQDLLRTVEDAACQAGIVSNMIDSISKAMSRVRNAAYHCHNRHRHQLNFDITYTSSRLCPG